MREGKDDEKGGAKAMVELKLLLPWIMKLPYWVLLSSYIKVFYFESMIINSDSK